MRPWRRAATLGLGAALVAALAGGPAAARESRPVEIVIEEARLDPGTLRAAVGERVTFVNRTGRPVHVEMSGDAGAHRVFQVPGRIWAVFHRPGPHPYVVHVSSGRGAGLRGVVDVEAGPARPELPTCPTVSVKGVCLDP